MQYKRINTTLTSCRGYYKQPDGTYKLQTQWYERTPGSKDKVKHVRRITHGVYIVVARRDHATAMTYEPVDFKPIFLRRVK